MAIDYLSADTATLRDGPDSSTRTKKQTTLLWGDRVRTGDSSAGWVKIKARGDEGWIRQADLGGKSLLEFYFIDVGQGDGVLIRTPDHRHIMIDGGYPRRDQPSGKNAADFVDWKFFRDYGQKNIELDAMVASHNDLDHYGGLWDLCSQEESAAGELNAEKVLVECLYHAGLSWWKDSTSDRTLGPFVDTDDGPLWTRLLGDRDSALAATAAGSGPRLQGYWSSFIKCLLQTRKKNGQPTPFKRLTHEDEYLPGFKPAAGKASIRVLGPPGYEVNGKPALRKFKGKDSINTNGQSILMRVDYGRARILLTGDLNTESQLALLKFYEGNVQELECDVAKACHHGSDDVSYRFLQALRPAVTVISSGDHESNDHPRPSIVAASATTGFLTINKDRIVTPLIYSTELARSHKFSKAENLSVDQGSNPPLVLKKANLHKASVQFEKRQGVTHTLHLGEARILADLIYGLVNVRTDGERIVCATMNEKDRGWEIKEIKSRF
jgi:beta-lactamase superfamily II metal-dependent hydrolase